MLIFTLGSASANNLDPFLLKTEFSVTNWNRTPGTNEEKLLAIAHKGCEVEIADTIKVVNCRYWGFHFKRYDFYHRYIVYNENKQRFDVKEDETPFLSDDESGKTISIITFIIMFILMGCFSVFISEGLFFFILVIWIACAGGLIFLNYYLGPPITTGLLVFSFRYEINDFFVNQKLDRKNTK